MTRKQEDFKSFVLLSLENLANRFMAAQLSMSTRSSFFSSNGIFYNQQLSPHKGNKWNLFGLCSLLSFGNILHFKKTFQEFKSSVLECSEFVICWRLSGRIIYSKPDKYCFYFFEQFAALVWVHLNKYKIF